MKNKWMPLLCLWLLVLSGCGSQTAQEEQTAASTVCATTQAETTEPTTEPLAPDTTDYTAYYDDTPNPWEPRAYTLAEIDVDITAEDYDDKMEDIYVNAEAYLGQMIRVQGIYLGEVYQGQEYHYVYQMQEGFAGHHEQMTGFEFTYNGEYPKNGAWIEVVGTLRQYMQDNLAYLTLDAIYVEEGKEPADSVQ